MLILDLNMIIFSAHKRNMSTYALKLPLFDYTHQLDECVTQGRDPRDIVSCLGQVCFF